VYAARNVINMTESVRGPGHSAYWSCIGASSC